MSPDVRASCAELTVLLVEDNRLSATVAAKFLAHLGVRVTLASNGREAVEAATRADSRPDLVLMDCLMPVLNGYEATRRIREWEAAAGCRRVPIVAMSATATSDDRQRCRAVGMDEFLAKPFTDTDLVQLMSALFSGQPRGNSAQQQRDALVPAPARGDSPV
jgi:hypothetical protein